MAGKRGRPKRALHAELQTLAEMLKNLPSHIERPSQQEQDLALSLLAENDAIGRKIIQSHKDNPFVSESLALSIASLGDEMLQGFEHKVLEEKENFIAKEARRRMEGGNTTRQLADDKAEQLYKKNRALIDKIAPKGNFSLHQVAMRIFEEWNALLRPRLSEEPDSLRCRGIPGGRKSVQTIGNWIKRHTRKLGF